MVIPILDTLHVIEVLENFVESKRPPVEIRHQLDISYRIEEQSVIIFELRPRWNNPNEIMECNIAKASFIKSSNHWKIYWQRSDLKWHSYTPKPTIKTIEEFAAIVGEDSNACFWG